MSGRVVAIAVACAMAIAPRLEGLLGGPYGFRLVARMSPASGAEAIWRPSDQPAGPRL